ncbi:MAG: DUF4184 family protein, partial [Sphingobacteriales bacterium]
VIGSMVPDFEYFIRMKPYSIYSHTLTGLLWFDVPLGLLLLFVYNKLIRNNVIDNLPASLNRRLSSYKNIKTVEGRPVRLLTIIICLLIGACSHLFWDSFTHVSGYFVTGSSLSDAIDVAGHAVPVFKILQHSSTLIGFLVIAYAGKQLPIGDITHNKTIVSFWISVFVITVAVVTMRIITGVNLHEYGTLITSGITGFILGLLLTSVYYNFVKG